MNGNAQRMARHAINCGATGNTLRAALHTLGTGNNMITKKHYIYRARRWFEFQSLAAAREFLRTYRLYGEYRHDLAPREVTQSHAAWGFLR